MLYKGRKRRSIDLVIYSELAKKRQQKEEELMKKCTFQPNVHKRESIYIIIK
jgi:hypothetical protein